MYHQLLVISLAISERVVDGKYHYPSKVSQEAAAVEQDLLWHLTSAYMKRVYGWAGGRVRGRALRHNQSLYPIRKGRMKNELP